MLDAPVSPGTRSPIMSGPAWARVDDLVAGTARLFPRAEAELVAWRSEEVPAVLDEVERRADAGWWAFGMVTYEAAAGLDPTLVTREPVDGLPLAWFGLTRESQAVPVVAHGERTPCTAGPWSPE